MPKEFINPNLHVVLIHYPLALIGLGILIEVFSFLGWRRSGFRAAGRWMLLLGILSLPPVLLSGLYALGDVNKNADTALDATWIEVRQQSPIQGQAWEFMTRHAWSSAFGSVALLALMVLWMGSSDAWRRKLHFLYVLGVVAGFVSIVWGAWHAGEMVYRHGVGVEVVRESGTTGEALTGGSGSGSAATAEQTVEKTGPDYYAPPLQVHVILAGATISLALAALGLSLRAGARDDVAEQDGAFSASHEQAGIASALNPSFSRPAYPGDLPDPHDAPPPAPTRPYRTPAGRFWLLATLIAVGASLSGVWTLAQFSDIWEIDAGERVQHLVQQVTDRDLNNGSMLTRRLTHTILGGGIIVLLLLLSLIARVTAGRRFAVLLFTVVLIVAVVAQVWIGSLLMFDTPSGRLGSFNEPTAAVGESPSSSPDETGEKPVTAPATLPTFPAVPATLPATTTKAAPVP